MGQSDRNLEVQEEQAGGSGIFLRCWGQGLSHISGKRGSNRSGAY